MPHLQMEMKDREVENWRVSEHSGVKWEREHLAGRQTGSRLYKQLEKRALAA